MISNSEKILAKKKLATNLGRMCVILALVGIVALFIWFKSYVTSVVKNRDEMIKYEKFILPVVMMDPVPFDDASQVDKEVALQIAMWDSLLGENRENFAYDENGMLLVPATDLDVSAHKLFGEGLALNHATFYDADGTYLYDPDIMAYRVPSMAKVSYTPYVESVTKTPEKTILKVGYVPPGNMWSTKLEESDDREIRADKYMFYDLYKGEDGYYIGSIRDIDALAPPMS